MKHKIESSIACPRCEGRGWLHNPAFYGALARERRLKAGVTLREVARRMNLTVAYLSDLELGRRGWRDDLMKRYVKAVESPRLKAELRNGRKVK
mgnify:CR=1 FL=1